jgi:acyl-CoA hydrolase
MELFTLETTAELLGKTTRTVKSMVKRGELVAVYPRAGKVGRPSMMITASSYGKYLLAKKKKKGR